MSFYGNIYTKIDAFWNKIISGDTEIQAPKDGGPLTIETAENDRLAIKCENSIIKVDATQYGVSISPQNTDQDGLLTYILYQGNEKAGKIDIPLDLILNSATIVDEDESGNTGKFIKLVFKTVEGTGETAVYINVNDLVQTFEVEGTTLRLA